MSHVPLRVTDILIRGGGGTVTFSDNVTVEFIYQFIPDINIPAGGIFTITLTGDRARLVYQNIVSQALCDTIDWLLQCSSINRRLTALELRAGLAREFTFVAGDWATIATGPGPPTKTLTVIGSGVPGIGEVGPHELDIGGSYFVSIYRDSGVSVVVGVDVEVEIDLVIGDVTLTKTPNVPDFAGRVIISSVS